MTSDTENYKNLKTFFNEEYNSLRAYAQSRINDTADRDAEDIVQEVALKLFSRADDVSPINNIAGFVYNAVKNKIIDLMRTNKRQVRVDQEMENRLAVFSELFYDSPEDSYSEAMKDELKKAIGNLKPHYREIILAIDFEGYTYNQVSLETGIPKGTLMSRRHRAISILLSMLEKKKEVIN
ncbi:RNA polymerase sigma factor [Kriegella aquimaris]|uniref:RNA polymerase sigma-70 factor, ECF subfamily n=1 Tax=Kriegella aquimaris TaxID=192904 RepID=A0A1G9QXX5_9FLAO|nr:RNA polymerase sigma factor [Kriegella aquimaris]SDM15721.1 RNA polymerase sigma-70 factor, ECF subfamily [Kriegella aquimaris]